MVTARAETSDEVEGLQVGADDYVTKPFDADVLRQRVGGVLTLQERLRRRLREQLRDKAPTTNADPETAERSDFERKARETIRQHLSDPDFDVEALAEALHMSRSTLYRRFRERTDTSPADLITQLRIEQAATLLREDEGTATQVAYAVGYQRLADFSDQFEDITGVRPSRYAA